MHRIVVIAVALVAAACSKQPGKATATFEPKSGSQVTGTATFEQKDGSLEIVVEAKSLPPGKHGVALHEKGDCSGSNASAVGARFGAGGDNKTGVLGDLEAGASGEARLKIASTLFTVAPGDHSLVGRSIVISSDPANPALPTTFGIISCGVIEIPK